MEAARLTATIDADSKEGEEGLKRFHGLLGNATEGFKGLLETAGGFALGGGILAGIGAIGGFLKDAVTEGAAANEGIAQTEAVLKSTGGAAGVTADMVDKLSTAFMNSTGIQDDTVRSAENMLLTFTNIKDNVFPDATKTVLDMSTALGQDTKNSAIQLGKALNDPEKGITALQRVGVTFDAQQKELIKTYVQHGNMAGAQGVILKELNKEFGGSAEAAGKANGGVKILSAQFDNLKQGIGQAVIPILVQLGTAILPIVSALLDHLSPAIADVSQWAQAHLSPILSELAGFITTDVLPAVGQLAGFVTIQVVPAVQQLVAWFEKNLLPTLTKFAGYVLTNVVPVIVTLATWAGQNLIPIVKSLAEVFIKNVLPALEGVWDSISRSLLPALENLWNKISPILTPALQLVGWTLQNVVGPALSVVIGFVSKLIDVISTVIDKIGGLLGKLGDFKDAAGGLLSHLPHFATGGVTLGGQFVGAENGPELLMKPGVYSAPPGSMIFNAQDTRRILGSGQVGGGGVTNTYNIYPAKAQFGPEELDTIQRRYALLGNTGGGY